jgi:multidrug efflux pump subunit AcrB
MPGILGQFFKNFGFTVVVAVLMSLFVARLITPLMAAYMLKSHGPEPHGDNAIMRGYLTPPFTLRTAGPPWSRRPSGADRRLFSQLSSPSCRRRTVTSRPVRVFLPPARRSRQAEAATPAARCQPRRRVTSSSA